MICFMNSQAISNTGRQNDVERRNSIDGTVYVDEINLSYVTRENAYCFRKTKRDNLGELTDFLLTELRLFGWEDVALRG